MCSGATAASTDSGQGTESLSDAFVAITAGKEPGTGSKRRVQAPDGVSQLLVRRSGHIASSKSQSTLQGTSHTSVQPTVEAPPGVK
jgi:hypothetical protein